MKKAISVLLGITLLLGLCGCASNGENNGTETENSAQTISYNEIENTTGDILNASFEDGLDYWQVEENLEGAVYTGSDSYSGDAGLSMWALSDYESEAKQVISGVEPGYYYLTCYAQNSGGHNSTYVYANGTQQSKCMTAIPVSNEYSTDDSGWTLVTVRGIEVGEDGIVTIGVYSDANKRNYINLDDFALIREEDQNEQTQLLLGGDISQLSYVEDCGAKFYDQDGNEADCLQILADAGWTMVRLRYYVDPGKGHGDGSYYCPEGYLNAEDVLELARRAKEKGMVIQLTFHLSDYWTNGTTQYIPNEWQEEIEGMSDEEAAETLAQCVYDDIYTLMSQMAEQGTTPEYVTIGNEIQSGVLFPYGVRSQDTWANLAAFLNAGYDAVKAVSPDTQVGLHLDAAGDQEKYEMFFDGCEEYGVQYDMIGCSYYPYYNGYSVADVVEFCNWLVDTYGKKIMIMETGYNFNPTRPSGYAGQLADNGCYEGIYESSPEGQRDFLIELFNGLKTVKNGYVVGDLYWDPIMVEQDGVGWAYVEDGDYVDSNVVSNTTLFDFDHKLLAAWSAYAYNQSGSSQGEVYATVTGDGDMVRRISNTEIEVSVGGESFTMQTDSAGGFYLSLDETENAEISISVSGYQSLNTETVTVTRGEDSYVNFQVDGGNLSGKVTDEYNNPVTNAEVYLYRDDLTYRANTDENGSYVFEDLPEGTYTIGAWAEGYSILTEEYAYEVVIGVQETDVNFEADLTSGTITGYLLDENGDPLPWPSVSATGGGETHWGTVDTTDGSFVIPYVPAGTDITVSASCWSYDSAQMTGVFISEGETTQLEAFSLHQQLGSVSGKVADADGNAVAGASVSLDGTGGTYETTTDENGNYFMQGMIVGNYYVTASADGKMAGVSEMFAVETDNATAAPTITLATPLEIVNGSFEDYIDGDETIPTGWEIDCTSYGTDGSACYRQNRDRFGGTTDGAYALSLWKDAAFYTDAYQAVELESGTYMFTAQVYSGITSDFIMYVEDAEGNILAQTLLSESDGYVRYGLQFSCETGEIHIGFRTDTAGGDWAVIDSVELGILE